MIKIALMGLAAYFLFLFLSDETGCESYASKYSCKYVKDEATYEVYHWRNVSDNDPNDERYIGSTVGLSNCRDMAIRYARTISDTWSERSYICALMKDGQRMEKHRL